MSGIRWTSEEVEQHLRKFKSDNRVADKATDLERAPSNESVGKKKAERLSKEYRIRCHTKGRRLGDCDGRAAKYIVDAITEGGFWPDDGHKFVKEICFTQEAATSDETVIEVWEAK